MNIVDADDPSYEIEVYTEEFSGDPLDPSVVLVEGNSYFVGQTNPAGSNCPSTRVAIQYLTCSFYCSYRRCRINNFVQELL